MPLPVVIIPIAIALGAGGLGLGGKGVYDLAKVHKMVKEMSGRNAENMQRLELSHNTCKFAFEKLGEDMFRVSAGFRHFIKAYEKIHNRPDDPTSEYDVDLPKLEIEEIGEVSAFAVGVLGVAAGAGAGIMFGGAASAGMTAVVMALGTASTATKIAALSGAAATKAILAALGGGSIAAGGGGVALGVIVLKAAATGVGLIIGGAIFAIMGHKALKKAVEAYALMVENEKLIDDLVAKQDNLIETSKKLKRAIFEINDSVYIPNVKKLRELVAQKSDYNTFTEEEKLLLKNNKLVVRILYKLINTPLQKVSEVDDDGNPISVSPNTYEVHTTVEEALKLAKTINT